MTTYNINHPPRNLQHSDKIVFHVPGHNRLEYKVFSDHIGNRIDGCNRRVFIELGIGDEYDYSMGSPTAMMPALGIGRYFTLGIMTRPPELLTMCFHS